MKKLFICLVFYAAAIIPVAAADSVYLPESLSDEAVVSLITAGPTSQIHTIFGHSLLRVKDEKKNIDISINYGVYNPLEKNFLLKFLAGTSRYTVSARPAAEDLFHYSEQLHVELIQQDLNLTLNEKNKLLQKIKTSLAPENRYYRYDFFFDNCTTRLRDLIFGSLTERELKLNPDESNKSFRQLIDEFSLPSYPHYDFIYDLLLGVNADRIAAPAERLFLPVYLYKALANAELIDMDGKTSPLVSDTYPLNDYPPTPAKSNLLRNPAFWLWIVFAMIVILLSVKIFTAVNIELLISTVFAVYLFLSGVIGMLYVILHFFSLHDVIHSNMQIIWIWPLHLFLFWLSWKKELRLWSKIYFIIWSGVLFLEVTGLPGLITGQKFHPAMYPMALSAILLTLNRLGVYNYLKGKKNTI